MKARLISVLLVLALLVTVGIIAAQAETSTETIDWTNHYCEACGTNKAWTALTKNETAKAFRLDNQSTTDHWYVPDDITDTGYYTNANGTVCVDLNGKDIVGKSIAFEVRSKCTLNIQDSVGGATVTGNNTATSGLFVYSSTLNNLGTMNIRGGEYLHGSNSVYDVVTYSSSVLRVYEGVKMNCDVEGVVDLQANGTTALYDCDLGVVQGYSGKQLKLNGAITIDELDLITNSGHVSYVKLTEGASIGLLADGAFTKTVSGSVFADQTAQAVYDAGYFTPLDTNRKIVLNAEAEDEMNLECNLGDVTAAPVDPMDASFNDALVFTGNTAKCPLCGLPVVWTALPENGETLTPGKHYYLDDHRELTKQYATTGGSSATPAEPITIHLNGYNITSAETRVFFANIYSTLNVIGKGTVSGGYNGKESTDTSRAATIMGRGDVNLYGGTYTHTGTNPTVLFARPNDALSIYQAKFVGTEDATGSHISLAYGYLNIYGGSIAGGVANDETNNVGANVNVGENTRDAVNGQYHFVMSGGTIDGGVYITNRDTAHSISISGTAKIANTNGGLTIAEGQDITVGELADTAEIYVTAKQGVAFASEVTDLADAATKFKAAEEGATVAAYNDQLIIKAPNGYKEMADAITDFTAADCPICGEVTEWKVATSGTLAAGHYYVTAEEGVDTVTLDAPIAVEEGTVCIHLNGKNVTSAGLVANVAEGATLNVMGTGVVTGAQAETAATIDNAGTLNLYGGTIKHAIDSTAPSIHTTGNVNVYEGTLITADKGEDNTVTTDDVNGSNIHVDAIEVDDETTKNGRLYVYGGTISNGTAVSGGNIFVGNSTTHESGYVYLYGGLVTGGTATSTETTSTKNQGGGNICGWAGAIRIYEGAVVSNGTANFGGNIYSRTSSIYGYGALIEGGHATLDGGNIYTRNATLQPESETVIQNGIADRNGGNYYQHGGSLSQRTGSKFIGGTAESGGNMYLRGSAASSGNSLIEGGTSTGAGSTVYFVGTTWNWVACDFVGGNAGGNGCFYIESTDAHVTIKAGDFTSGTAQDGAIFYVREGILELQKCTLESTVGKEYTGAQEGNAVYLGSMYNEKLKRDQIATLKLNGKTIINNDAWTDNVWVNAKSKLEVTSAFTGNVRVMFNETVRPGYGEEVAQAHGICAANFTGKLTMPNMEDVPLVFFSRPGDTANGEAETVTGLKTLGAKYTTADGDVWATTADAFAAENATAIKLYETGATVEITESPAAIDLNGKSITINGTGVVTAANSDATAASAVTLGEGVSLANTAFATWNEDHYDVVLGENGEYTIHRLEMRIKSISLRPGSAGLYYTSEIIMDKTLKAQVNEVGVVLAVGDGNVDLSDPAGDNVEFIGTNVFDSTVNSVLVNNILTTDATNNDDRASWKVQGAAAVVFNNEEYLVATAENFARGCSLTDFMGMAYEQYAEADDTDATKIALSNFYDKWYEAAGWDYPNFAKAEANA